MRWFSAFLVGNDSRTKLGLRLEKQNKALKYASSDAMCLNVFDVMLEICSKFNSRTSNLVNNKKGKILIIFSLKRLTLLTINMAGDLIIKKQEWSTSL